MMFFQFEMHGGIFQSAFCTRGGKRGSVPARSVVGCGKRGLGPARSVVGHGAVPHSAPPCRCARAEQQGGRRRGAESLGQRRRAAAGRAGGAQTWSLAVILRGGECITGTGGDGGPGDVSATRHGRVAGVPRALAGRNEEGRGVAGRGVWLEVRSGALAVCEQSPREVSEARGKTGFGRTQLGPLLAQNASRKGLGRASHRAGRACA